MVEFLNPGQEAALWENGNSILQKLDVTENVKAILPEIAKRASTFVRYLNPVEKEDIFNIEQQISKDCFKCEYKNPNNVNELDGYKECLGERAYAKNHIFELYYVGTIGGNNNPLVNKFLQTNEELSISKFQVSDFRDKKGNIGSRNERQIIQYENTLNNTEYISECIQTELNNWDYPLHFIDFETYRGAIPMHKGMKPYETVAFQWSCHTIINPGDAPIHSEWLNTENTFPNFRFAESLMQQIGEKGTPLMWATHENTTLREILSQLNNANDYTTNYSNEVLKEWLFNITKATDEKGKTTRLGRLQDMNAFTLKHYFHPFMKGKTSIKKTLPAVWNNHSFLHGVPYFKPYYKEDIHGNILNPYETLKYQFEDVLLQEMDEAEIRETVKEGGAAMQAYFSMLNSSDIKTKERLQKELLNYCKLDTMAMVIIWHYWKYH